VTRLNIAEKVEGIAVWSAKQKTLAFVTDADDPEKPAALYLSTRQTRQESIFYPCERFGKTSLILSRIFRIACSVASQPMQPSVTDTPYCNLLRSCGID